MISRTPPSPPMVSADLPSASGSPSAAPALAEPSVATSSEQCVFHVSWSMFSAVQSTSVPFLSAAGGELLCGFSPALLSPLSPPQAVSGAANRSAAVETMMRVRTGFPQM
ncbi:hypothetical protein AB852_11485 [Streptomyces uncialis]|uniref:Uncharacterized protein n=1 Tax=Streptomyces uncialis TaxID=1048205 RepID=A0A1Q4VAP8_9ACTN|nr:hypothetical protein AB852_11485 [Streptomyces uncialis]